MPATRALLRFLAAGAVAAAAASPALAQSAQKLSVQISPLFTGVFGSAYEGMDAGPGIEAQLRYTPSVWSFGGGFQYSSHGVSEAELSGESVKLMGVFFEPRRVFDVGSVSYAPYVSARLAFLRQSIDFSFVEQGETYDVSASASGAQINAGGGVLFRLSPRVNLDVGATFGVINFGDVEASVAGLGDVTLDGTSGTGQNLVLRVGFAFGLGR
jgi:hypothetical protein